MSFSGRPTHQRKIDLRGRSRGEESREQVLERTRAERERRQRSKLEHKSASTIQAFWRQAATARQVSAQFRQTWTSLCSPQASGQALQDLLAQDSRILSSLLCYYDAKQQIDRQALASVCCAVTASAVAGQCPLFAQAAAAAVSYAPQCSKSTLAAAAEAAPATTTGPNEQQLALFRLQRLALMCLTTLAAGGHEASAALSSPYASLPNLQQQQQQPQAAMLDFLIKVVNPDAWRASMQHSQQQQQHQEICAAGQQQRQQPQAGPPGAAAAAAAGAEAVLKYLFNKELMAQLRMMLLALHPGAPPKTCAEVCVTQMVVRSMQLQLLPLKAPPQPTAAPRAPSPAGSEAAVSAQAQAAASCGLQMGVSQLLCVPGLWTRAPSLVPVAGRLCGLGLVELVQLQSSKQLVDVLLQGSVAVGSSGAGRPRVREREPAAPAAGAEPAAAAVAAVVENLVEAGAAGTLLKSLSQAEQVHVAGRLVGSLVLLLDAARQLSVMQQRQWRMKSHRQQQQGSGGRSIYDLGASTGTNRRAGYVPGVGFVSHAKGPQAMDVDTSPAQAAAAGAAAAAPQPTAMEVDGAARTVGVTDSPSAETEAAAAVGVVATQAAAADAQNAAAPGAANAAAAAAAAGVAGAGADKARASKAAAADAAILEQPVAASAWSAEQADNSTPAEVAVNEACMQLLAGSNKGLQLLRLLVGILLPATTADESRTLRQQAATSLSTEPAAAATSNSSASPTGASVAVVGSSGQQQLLELVWTLSRAPEYRQKVWLGLSVGARLVPRLWYSLLLPLHLSTPGGFLYYTGTSSDSSSSSSSSKRSSGGGSVTDQGRVPDAAGGAGSWMLPLVVLCQGFSAALSFTHLEDFYSLEGAACLLPLTQLFDRTAPTAGLVLLVKAAVWQVLWFKSVAPPGVPPPTPAVQQQQQQLKAAVAEVCGLLLCQLHDRNCVREFCPPSAFLCELATAAPARLQQEVGAAAARMGMSGEDSEDDGADDFAWQQQQQWQQQRQQGLGPLAAVAAAAGEGEDGFGSGGSSMGGGGGNMPAAGLDGSEEQGRAAAAAAASGGGKSPGSRVWLLLEHAPCLVPFELRVQLLQLVLAFEKEQAVEAGEARLFDDPMVPGGNIFVTIRRDQIMQDGFDNIGRMDPDRIKGRLRIQYVNEAGLAEAGIDGGGLFKDFMEELLRQGFSPQSELMAENPQHQLYPNPAAYAFWPDSDHRLGFLGRMLGKCLYEGMLLELPLAAFFLKKMRGGVCDINDMPSLDPQVYKHLLQLRHYTGDFSELSLTFMATVVEPIPGASNTGAPATRQREVELKPGGRDIPVKADNVIEYIHRLADFRLNRQMDRAAAAFLRGFFELIKPRWVRMFNEAELQMLISGSEEGVDVDDLMQHIVYAGGYYEEHPVVITLWDTLRGFTPQQQRQFLKFVTSCSRAPLLGFAYLEPRICVQMSGGMLQPGATQRLPTAATCMNLLKLPPYRTVKEMREKLLYAISAGAGFELS